MRYFIGIMYTCKCLTHVNYVVHRITYKVLIMHSELLGIFKARLKHLKFDDRFAKHVMNFSTGFISKNANHTEFFGSTLIGTPKIAYVEREDGRQWFEDVLDVDEEELKIALHSAEAIDPSHSVGSNTFNLSTIYLLHGFLTSKNVSERRRSEVLIQILVLLQAKFLTSLVNNFLEHEVNKDIAIAAYASLSKRFILKQMGSWIAYFRYRAEDVLSDSSIHIGTLKTFKDDEKITYVLSDVQSRLRATTNLLMDAFTSAHAADTRIQSSSSISNFDGEESLGAKVDNNRTYADEIASAARSRDDFIIDDVRDVILALMPTLPPKSFDECVEFIPDNYGNRKAEFIDELLEKNVVHALGFIRENKLKLTDLRNVLIKLRSMYMAPKAADEYLLRSRELASEVVSKSVTTTNKATLASARVALMLYITLRALVYSKYT